MNSFGRTALAVAVAGGLFSYIYFVESKKDPKENETQNPGKGLPIFTGFDKLKVTALTLRKRGGDVIEVKKSGENWSLVSPRETPADAGEISSLLDTLQSLKTDDVVSEASSDLVPFGLAPPKVAVSVLAEGASKPFEFELGDNVPAGSGSFARVPGQPRLFTVSSTVENTLDKSAFDLRDRGLLKAKKDDVQWFELIEKGRTVFKLARGGPGEEEWRGEIPVGTRAARWTVEGFLGMVENLRMESLVTEEATPRELAADGLGAAARRLVLGFDESKSVTLEIGKKTEDGKYYARDASSRLIATITKGFKNFRANRLLEVAAYEMTGFDVVAPDSTRTFTKGTTKAKDGLDAILWRSAPPVKDASPDKVSNAFFTVGALEASAFIDAPGALAAYGLDAPALKVTVRFDEDTKKEDWFEVAIKGDNAFGRRRGDAAVLKLDKAKTEELIKTFTALGS